jgi:hypothetical protein
MANGRLAVITFLDTAGAVDPGYGQPAWSRPDNSLPSGGNYPSTGPIYGGGHPGNALPGGGHIALLPVFPFDPTRPDQGLPGSGGSPDNSLPGSGGSPDQGLPRPGKKYVVKWLACQGLILVPDQGLPETPEPK